MMPIVRQERARRSRGSGTICAALALVICATAQAQDSGREATRGLPVLGNDWSVTDDDAFRHGDSRVFQTYNNATKADITKQRFVYVPPHGAG